MKALALFFNRYFIAGGSALIVIFCLFWLMQYLINIADRELDEDDPGRMLEFVRVIPEEVVSRRETPPRKPPPPDEPPDDLIHPDIDKITPESTSVTVPPLQMEPTDIEGPGSLPPSEGDYLPIVKVQPVYPRRALSRGIEGYVIVEFTVTKSGTTKDIRIVEAVPPGIFDKASLAAAAKFKYRPRIENGQSIEVTGVQNKITFELEE